MDFCPCFSVLKVETFYEMPFSQMTKSQLLHFEPFALLNYLFWSETDCSGSNE